MPRQVGIKTDFTFVQGLITDRGYLTSMPNAWIEGDNIIPFRDGHLERRVKVDLENTFQYSSTFSTANKQLFAYSVDLWTSVGGNGLLNFAVAQAGHMIYFYDASTSVLSPSLKSFSIDLTPYASGTTPNVIGTSAVSIASGNGKLLIVSEDTNPILVTYDATLDDITVTQLTLKIRDFYGVDDGLTPSERPGTLSAEHRYNLQNQGWNDTRINAYQASTALYPSNAQIWFQGKNSSDVFDPPTLDLQDFGNSKAPLGHFILDVFNRNRSTVSGIPGLTAEVEDYRPKATCFFAGRAWYSGISSNTIGSWVMFSRVIDTDASYEECYQQGDPTAEWSSDLLASDGGVIPIPNAGGILKLQPIQESLIVFAQNGIWQILGDSGGFRSDGYQVKQIASFGIVSAKSVVEVENTVAFWASSGIYMLERDNVSGDFVPKSISLGKVDALYGDYQELSNMPYVSGFYDSVDKVIYWMHYLTDDAVFGTTDQFKINKILCFNTLLGAFYTMTIASLASNSPEIVGGFLSPNLGLQDVTYTVVDSSGNPVIDASVNPVVATLSFSAPSPRIPKFLTVAKTGANWAITFSDFLNTASAPAKFKDWYSYDDVGAETDTLPYIISNFEILGDAARMFQAPYIVTHLYKTETGIDSNGDAINQSSCLLQGRWDWTDSSTASRWTTEEEVYRHRQPITVSAPSGTFDTGYPVVSTKSKIRGRGQSLHLKFSSSSGKDMKLAGWAVQLAKNTNV